MEQWFLGLRHSQEREVRDEERQALETELHSERQRLRVGILLAALGLFLVGTMGVVWEVRDLPHLLIEEGLALLLVCMIPFLLYRLHCSQTRMRRLTQDLKNGVVLRFEGSLARESLFENENRKAHATLIAEGLLAEDPEQRQSIELLPGTGRVLSANGKPSRVQTTGEVRVAAAPPEHPYLTSLPDGYVVTLKYPDLRSARRRMTEEEIEELEEQIHRYRQPGMYTMASMVLFCIVLLMMVEAEESVQLRLLPLLILSVLGGVAYVRRWIQSTRLQADRTEAWLITIHDPAEEDEGMSGLPLNAPRAEVLPVSEGLWTERGKPAPWRFG